MVNRGGVSFPESCQEVDVDYVGNDINSCGIKTQSWQNCGEECRKHVGCLYWTWLSNDYAEIAWRTLCCLKNSTSGRTNYRGLISGSKQCGNTRKFP